MSQRDWDDSEQEDDDEPEEPQPPLDADAASPEDLDESGETLHPEDWDRANDVADEKAPPRYGIAAALSDVAFALTPPVRWIGRRLSPIRKLPTPLLALLLILPALVIGFANPWGRWWGYVGTASAAAALLLPGAIKRGKWSHCLVMLAFGLAAFGLDHLWSLLGVPARYPYGLLHEFIYLPLIAGGEWFFACRGSRWNLGLFLASALAVACLLELVRLPLSLGEHWPPKAIFLGIGLPLLWALFGLSRRASGGSRLATSVILASAALGMGAFVVFSEVLLVPLGRISLCGQGPFTRMAGMEVCLIRKDSSAIDLGFRELERIDWNADIDEWRDWRRSFLKQFYEKHPDEAAERGSRILLAHPTGPCTGAFAAIMAERRRDEAYPIMLWYSLAACFNIANAGYENVKAVLGLDFPHVAYLVLYDELGDWRRPRQGAFAEMTIRDDARKRLTALLGHDAGADGNEWDRQLPTWVSERTTSLSPQRVQELNKVVSLFAQCVMAKVEAKKLIKRGAFVRMVADGNLAEAKWLLQEREKRETSQTVEEMGRKAASAVSAFIRATRLVEEELGTTVEWNKPGIIGLEEGRERVP